MKKTRIVKLGAYLIIVGLAMLYGMLSYKLHLPPYDAVHTLSDQLFGGGEDSTPGEYLSTNVDELISIRKPEDVTTLRDELITLLWGGPGLPASMPASVVTGHVDPRYADIRSLARIDKLVVAMEFGLESRIYHFIPVKPRNHLVLYHEGHEGDFYNSREQIRKLLDNGYPVLAFSMPLLGPNNQPILQMARLGKLKLTNHDQMSFLAPPAGHPVKYFIEPIIVALNYAEKQDGYSFASMIGISGGGWATTLAAAVDPRIVLSFPAAGSYPHHLRSNTSRDWGDYEQVDPKLYNTANYPELYVLGAYGGRRKQLQIINKYDPCCFGGTKWETYKDVVRGRVRDLGAGEFDLFLDTSHRGHIISGVAMIRILEELNALK